jgi:peptidoglycan/xylan/chitin deacetylase (PgdA/CDA1 family)
VTGRTVVSLTFDDGTEDHAAAGRMLGAHAMRGTFFINAGTIGEPGYLTWEQLTSMAAEGQEIGGHTLDHVDLAKLDRSAAGYQIEEDRARLLAHGFADTSFAYPYGSGWHDPTIRAIVRDCGYSAARGAWGLVSQRNPSATAYCETVPPQDVWAIRTAPNPRSTTSLDTIQGHVTNAEASGGGWLILVFHEISDVGGEFSVSPAIFRTLLEWLASRSATGTTVKTIDEVVCRGE